MIPLQHGLDVVALDLAKRADVFGGHHEGRWFRTSSGSAVSSTTSPVGGEQALDPIASWPEDSARGRSRAATELLLE